MIECGADLSGLPLDVNHQQPVIDSLDVGGHHLTDFFGIRQIPFDTSIGRSLFCHMLIHGRSDTITLIWYDSSVDEQCTFVQLTKGQQICHSGIFSQKISMTLLSTKSSTSINT